MPIAKETLFIGFTPIANEGTYVPKELVDKYGWKDKVTDGADIGGGDEAKQRRSAKAEKPADK